MPLHLPRLVSYPIFWHYWKLMRRTDFLVTDFGAIGDGKTLCTKELQQALDRAGEIGGARVVVPPGVYLTGTLQIRSNTTLEIMAGASVFGSPDRNEYLPTYKHVERHRPGIEGDRRHLIYIDDAHHVTICGRGQIHGNDEAFWDMENVGSRGWIPAKPDRVSNLLHAVDCQDLRFEGITLTHSPEWTMHLLDCDRVVIDGIRIYNNFYGPNNDGIDLTGCRDVLISNCDINTSDDAICLKTFPKSRTCERIAVTNCSFRTNCVAVKVGTETWQDIRGFTIQNCIIRESTRAFGLYCHRGGTIEDIIISNIIFDSENEWELNRAIQIDLQNRDDLNNWGEGPLGRIRNVQINNFLSRSDGRIMMTARDGARLEDISLSDVRIFYPGKIDDPDPIGRVSGSEQWPNYAEGRTVRAAIIAENIENLSLRDISVRWPGIDMPAFCGVWCRNVKNGVINAPLLTASHEGVERVAQVNSEMRVLH